MERIGFHAGRPGLASAFLPAFWRLIAGTLAATMLVLTLPSPATAAPTPGVTISDATVVEGTGSPTMASFTIQVAPPPKVCCSLQVSWATAPGSANAPGDFTAASGTVTLTRANTSRTVTVSVVGDPSDESNETFVVNLTTLVGTPGQITDAQGVGTITDNDPAPSLSVNDVSVTEGNTGTTTATFTVSPSAASGNSVTFDWATAAGTATAGTDYASASGSATIAAGATSTTMVVTVNGDVLDEYNETFTVTLSNPVNASIADGTGIGTINDDDPAPALSIGDVSLGEGNAGTTTATFTVSLSVTSGKTVTFDWATAAGSAAAGTDYVSASGSRTIAAGATTATIDVSVNGDVVDETNETFTVVLSNPANATITDGSGLGTITDDDAAPALSIGDVTVAEGNSGTTTATFTVSLSAPSGSAVTFDWATAPGSATAGTDYASASGSRTIAAGATTATIAVSVNGDVMDEGNETFSVALSNPANATIADGSGQGTITDDDPAPALSVGDVSVTEGSAGTTTTTTFTVSLSAASSNVVTFDWATAPGHGRGRNHYVSATGSRTIAPGATSATIVITVNGDTLDEADETFTVALSNPANATIADGSGQGTITDDDPAPALSVTDVSVTEGNAGTTTATFTVSLSAVSGKTVTLDWATAAGTAAAGTDYVSASGSRTIAAGATSATIVVTVNGDTLDEADEIFTVALSNPGNATISDGSAQGTITDDDPAPTLSIGDVSITEGNAGTTTATFAVSLSVASGRTVTLDWATAPGSASAGSDFVSASGSSTIAAGATSTTIDVTVNGDATDENNETFTVALSNLVNATIADGSGQGTITDDDAAPTLSLGDVSVTEGNAGTTTALFTVSLSAASGKTITVDWATSNGTAVQPADYATGSGALTFVPGDTSETLMVSVNGDVIDEADETFTVALSNPTNATIADGSGQGTITDDDALPTLSVNDTSLPEGNAGSTTATFTVSLSAASGRTITVGWATADDDAGQPADYTAASGTLTFVPGDTSETYAVTVNGDLIAELDEAFRVTLTAPTNATLADATGIGTIVDDELLPVIDIDEPTALEGVGSITFAVTLSHPAAFPVTVDWSTAAGTATNGPDYFNATGTVTFAALDVSETVVITVNEDATFEHDETMALNLSNASGAPIGDSQGIGTIVNDDAAPELSVGNVSVTEGNAGQKMLTFTVSLTGDTEIDATVGYATAGITATTGSDYVDAAGPLTIPAGDTGTTVDVVVNGDVAYEPDETLSMTLGTPTNATLVDAAAVGTIRNDDKAPTTLTVRVARTATKVITTGILEHARSGLRVTATLFRKVHGHFVKIIAKTVRVTNIGDRDHDGKPDGAYKATFVRPSPAGTYKVVVRFKGAALFKPCTRAKIFTLPAR